MIIKPAIFSHPMNIKRLNVMLAEDDSDDRYFFEKALKELSIDSCLTVVHDGEELMSFLSDNPNQLPDVLFIDLNLPRKNGVECLYEIKTDEILKDLPVVMVLTTFTPDRLYEENMISLLLNIGALRFIHKTDDFEQLRQDIHQVLIGIAENKPLPERSESYY